MSTNSRFFRSLSTVKEFDGEYWEESSYNGSTGTENRAVGDGGGLRRSQSAEEVRSSRNTMVAIPSTSHHHLLIVSLLEHLCTLYVSDRKKSSQLFQVLCKQLTRMGIMSPLLGVDEVSMLRSQYRIGFSNLVRAAISTLSPSDIIPPGAMPYLHNAADSFLHDRPEAGLGARISYQGEALEFHMSRYLEEFVEHCKLGYGAYGNVFKAQHKLDGCEYAIKKIRFTEMKPDVWFKILREVKYLAGTNHKHIVRYHGAWLESLSPALLALREGSETLQLQEAANLPAIQYQDNSTSTKNANVDDEDSLSVVFEDSHTNNLEKSANKLLPAGEMILPDWSGSEGINPDESNSKVNDITNHMPAHIVLHIQMELCHETLKDWMSERNAACHTHTDVYNGVDEQTNLKLLKQILKAVDYIHSQSLIHRDLKPKNIFLIPQDNCLMVKIGDFGLARHLDREEPMTPSPGANTTNGWPGDMRNSEQSGFYTSGVGTTIYAAPEQLTGSDYDSKSDMFSIGLILYEMYQPFITEMERVHCLTDVRKGQIPPAFSARWSHQCKYIRDLTHIDPEKRASAHELLEGCLILNKSQVITNLKAQVSEQSQTIQNLQQKLQDKDSELEKLRLQIAYMSSK